MGLGAPELECDPIMKARPHRAERGAVLLLALLAVALIVSLLGSVLWRQSGLIAIESAERQRQQALWLLRGALDWGRLILREDARTGISDHLSEPWAVPLQESRLSSFLAAQSGTVGGADTLDQDVFFSGHIQDAQGRFNLTNLVQGKHIDPNAQGELARLLGLLGLPSNLSEDLAEKMVQSRQPGGAWLPPRTLDDLVAWGWGPDQIERLRAHVTILPERTPINVNTASPEVLSATVEGLSLAAAERQLADCEGSDWFWWFSRRHDSGMDVIWDSQFRLHLRNIYKLLGAKRYNTLAGASGLHPGLDGQVVGGALLQRLVEDGGVGGEPGDRQLVDVTLERAARQQVAGDVVEPETLALIVEPLGGVHRVTSDETSSVCTYIMQHIFGKMRGEYLGAPAFTYNCILSLSRAPWRLRARWSQ